MAEKGKAFQVDTSPTKEVVVSGLTRDATVEACIFDLIDNAIDAARETANQLSARNVLPDSYDGFQVELTFSGTGLKVVDNCGGIPVGSLRDMVLRFGRRSDQVMGIGVFGVGLNRALFKLGRVSRLTTDTGAQRSVLTLDTERYLKGQGWSLPAEEFTSLGKIGTCIEVGKPSDEIAQQFSDADWVEALRDDVGVRYGRFIGKGFRIVVDGRQVENREVQLRRDGPYEGEYKVYRTESGVSIHIEYGQHLLHRFPKEQGYDRAANLSLSGQFGWNILCNDRTIVVADRTDRTGWDTKFHTEFNGFVGRVSFVAAQPALLPWNTTKTDVDLNNKAYRLALKDMRLFAEKWRRLADQRKKSGGPPKPLPLRTAASEGAKSDTRTPRTGPDQTPHGAVAPRDVKPEPVRKADLHSFRTVLPDDIDERHCFDKHLVLVHEAKRLDLGDHPYVGLALIRMLFEMSVVLHLHRQGKFPELRLAAVERRRSKGMTITADEEKSVNPHIDEILPYLETHPEVWGAKTPHLRHALRKMKEHQPTMNSALHNPWQVLSQRKPFEVRDEALPLLRHLIET